MKMENLLNLALDATEDEQEKSLNLDVGYEPEERSGELIVRYSGESKGSVFLGIRVGELLGGYTILWSSSGSHEISRFRKLNI